MTKYCITIYIYALNICWSVYYTMVVTWLNTITTFSHLCKMIADTIQLFKGGFHCNNVMATIS